jgi:isoamyl acetate esterase
MKKIKHLAFIQALLVLLSCNSGFIGLHDTERIIFFGDSITQLGVRPNGYVTLIRDSLQKIPHYKNVEIIGAGISGNKVPDLAQRLQRDVLDKKPTIVVIYIGINDVWHSILPNLKGTPKDTFAVMLKDIIHTIQHNGAHVVLCTPSVVGEKHDGTNQLDSLLDEYSTVSRNVTSETGSMLCDLRKAFLQFLKINNKENVEKGILTTDKVHLNDAGNTFVANEILRVLLEQ